MAVGYVSKPGKKYGPCNRQCTHRDCEASRDTAACVCRFCGKPIGYETGYFDEWYEQPKNENGVADKGRYGYFVHALCLMTDAEKGRAAAQAAAGSVA